MTKIAVIGAGGMLGGDFANFAIGHGHEVLRFGLPAFDIRRPDNIREALGSAGIVVNCAAYTDVDGAETDADACYEINAKAAGILADECARRRIYLLHISTDFVFGDKSSCPLSEKDETNPLNIYGRSKLDGEKLIIASGADASILRLEWTYGVNGKNFIRKILSKAKSEGVLTVVDDQIGSPTRTLDAARAMLSLIQVSAGGIFHFAPRGYVSRFDLAKFAITEAGISADILPCSSADIKTQARRPLNSRFNCSKIDKLLDWKRPEWRESLSKYLREVLKF
jgi:dTDP-4-dehydrorhamnose reductase